MVEFSSLNVEVDKKEELQLSISFDFGQLNIEWDYGRLILKGKGVNKDFILVLSKSDTRKLEKFIKGGFYIKPDEPEEGNIRFLERV